MRRFEHDGRSFAGLRGSDVRRDGMYLEVSLEDESAKSVIEIFYSDQTDQMTVSVFQDAVPLELLEWAISLARESLPPIRKSDT